MISISENEAAQNKENIDAQITFLEEKIAHPTSVNAKMIEKNPKCGVEPQSCQIIQHRKITNKNYQSSACQMSEQDRVKTES